MKQQPTHFLAIDPGLRGAFALLDADCNLIILQDLPILHRGGIVGLQLDPLALYNALQAVLTQPATTVAVIEGVTSRRGNGVASAHSLGHSLGIVTGVTAALIPTPALLPPPALWKRALGLTADKQSSIRAFERCWPGVDPERHDRAEAALLARFGWLNRANASEEAWRQYRAGRSGHSSQPAQKKARARRAKVGGINREDDLGAFEIDP